MTKKIYLLLFCTFLNFAASIFADGSLVITNRSNTPVSIMWGTAATSTTKAVTAWTPSIPAGGAYTLTYTGSLAAFSLYYLKQGSSITTAPSADQLLDVVATKPLGFGGTISSSFLVPLSVFVYGDAATAIGMLTAAASVISGTAGAQLILAAGSVSRAVEFTTGTMTAGDETKTAQPVVMQSYSTDGKYTLVAY